MLTLNSNELSIISGGKEENCSEAVAELYKRCGKEPFLSIFGQNESKSEQIKSDLNNARKDIGDKLGIRNNPND